MPIKPNINHAIYGTEDGGAIHEFTLNVDKVTFASAEKEAEGTVVLNGRTGAWQDFVAILISNGYGVEIIPLDSGDLQITILPKEEQ